MLAPTHSCREFVVMSIVAVSSVNGLQSFAGLGTYCGSKAAIDHMARCAALDLAPHGIRVNNVNPGIGYGHTRHQEDSFHPEVCCILGVTITPLQKRGGMSDEACELQLLTEFNGIYRFPQTTHSSNGASR